MMSVNTTYLLLRILTNIIKYDKLLDDVFSVNYNLYFLKNYMLQYIWQFTFYKRINGKSYPFIISWVWWRKKLAERLERTCVKMDGVAELHEHKLTHTNANITCISLAWSFHSISKHSGLWGVMWWCSRACMVQHWWRVDFPKTYIVHS